MTNNLKRVCDLKPGDRFYWMGSLYHVRKVNGSVHCVTLDQWGRQTGNPVKFGVRNQMKVELKKISVC